MNIAHGTAEHILRNFQAESVPGFQQSAIAHACDAAWHGFRRDVLPCGGIAVRVLLRIGIVRIVISVIAGESLRDVERAGIVGYAGTRFHQPLADRTVRCLAEIAAFRVFQVRAPDQECESDVSDWGACEYAQVFFFFEVGDDQALPVAVEYVFAACGGVLHAAAFW